MALALRGSDKRRHDPATKDFPIKEEPATKRSASSRSSSPKIQMDQEKRIRREIANSNERRRMQSINAGFQSLRTLLPQHEGEKLSKAAILQQTAEYIYQLEEEKTRLTNVNVALKRTVGEGGNNVYSPHSPPIDIPPAIVKRRKTIDGAVESADEGIGSMSPEHSGSGEDTRTELSELRREMIELRLQLERERRHRVSLEEHIGSLQAQQQTTTTQYVRKYEQIGRWQAVEEAEPYNPQRIHEEAQAPRCYTIRNNLETIVEAIRHLEGDHLFSDERGEGSEASSRPSTSPGGAMELCSSPGSSPTHSSVEGGQSTVTSLKHHVLNRIARSSFEGGEEPMNLEFRPSRSPSPFLLHQTTFQQQLRPGVIVVKHP